MIPIKALGVVAVGWGGDVVGSVVGVVGDVDCAEARVVRNVEKRRVRRLADDVLRSEVTMIGKKGKGCVCVC